MSDRYDTREVAPPFYLGCKVLELKVYPDIPDSMTLRDMVSSPFVRLLEDPVQFLGIDNNFSFL